MSWTANKPLRRLRASPAFERLLPVALLVFLALILLCADTRIYRNFYYAGVIPVALLAVPRLRPRLAAQAPLWWAAIAYGACFLLPLPLNGTAGLDDVVDVARRLLSLLFFVTVVLWLRARDTELERRIFGWLAWVAAVGAVFALVTFYAANGFAYRLGPVPVVVPRGVEDPIANPNVIASLHAVIALGLLHHVLARRPLRGWMLLRLAVLFVLLVFVVATGSRAVLIGLAAALLASALARASWRPAAGVAVVALAVYLLLAVSGVVPWPGLLERGDSLRLAIWEQAWNLIRQRPWLGYGMTYPVRFPVAGGHVITHPHSIYLSHLLYGGMLGMAALLALLGLMAREAFARYRRDGNFGYGAFVVFIAVQGLFDFSVFGENAGWQWIHFWLPLALMAGHQAASPSRQAAPQAPDAARSPAG